MKAQKTVSKLLLAVFTSAATLTYNNAMSQATWDGSSVLTTTPGPVGIGLTAPNAALHIAHLQDLTSGSNLHTPALKIENNCNGSRDLSSSVPLNIVEVTNLDPTATTFNHNPTPYFIINTSGQTGILTGTPGYNLDVAGTAGIGNSLRMYGENDIYFRGIVGDTNHGIGYYGIVGSSSKIWDSRTIDGPVVYGFAGGALGTNQFGKYNTALRWNYNGQVMIGNQAAVNGYAGFALSVDGLIVCKHAIVQVGNWADDVFDANYALPTLASIQDYIAANHHLPNVPSTAEALEKGSDVGEMNVILLRKVEEMTLYMLELKKDNEELKKEIAKLSKP